MMMFMIRKSIVTAVLLMTVVSALAQSAKGTFTVQPQVGATVATIANMEKYRLNGSSQPLDVFVNAGLFFGVEFAYQLYDVVNIAVGINWSQQGVAWETYDLYNNATYVPYDGIASQLFSTDVDVKNLRVRDKVELGYLNLPVVASVYLYKGLAVKAGVQLGYLTNATERTRFMGDGLDFGRDMNFDVDLSRSVYEDCRKFDISVPIGISYELKVPVVIDARYNIGLTKVNKESIEGEKDWKNGVFRITVGYKFKL